MRLRVVSGFAAVGSALALLCALPAPASTSRPPTCITVAASPNFVHDGTAACARLVVDPTSVLTVDVTTDHGRSWSRAAATGLTWGAASDFVAQPMFSPRFASDHRLFIATDVGLFVTTDLGKTFTAADTSIQAGSTVTPMLYVGGAGAFSGLWPGSRLFAVGLGAVDRRLDVASGLDAPVVGSASQYPIQILGPTSDAGGAAASIYALTQASSTSGQSGVWACDDNLTCSTPLATFTGLKPWRIWSAPLSGGGSALLVFAQSTSDSSSHLLRSTDGGKTFKSVAQIDTVFRKLHERAGTPQIGLAMNRRYPGLVLMRVEGFPAGARRAGDQPAEQIYRSDDGGATWRRMGYQWGIMQGSPTGNLPFNVMSFGYPTGTAPIELTSDGHVLVPAQLEEYTKAGLADLDGVYCSVDFAKTWHRTCPR